MRSVSDDVKNKDFAPVYLIYGDEAYLRENYKRTLIKALVNPGDNLNYNVFRGADTDMEAVLSLAVTLPFMAEKRVILVQDSELFNKTSDELADYIENPSEDTVLIFEEEKVNANNRSFKVAKGAGYCVKAERYDSKKLPSWVAADFKRYGKKVSGSAVDLLIERAGTDMTALDMEVTKLVSYVGDREGVFDDDVMKMVHRSPSASVFQMIEAVVDRRLDRAVGLYYDMLSGEESPFGIRSLIERHFRILLIVKDMADQKADNTEISAAAGISEKIVWKYEKQAKKYSRVKIKNVLSECTRTERAIKQGRIADKTAVELLLFGIADTGGGNSGRNK